MKQYIHRRTKLIVSGEEHDTFYVGNHHIYDTTVIPKEIVENGDDWVEHNPIPANLNELMNIPCLSINDIGKVFLTANRENPNNELKLDAMALVKIVQEKLEKLK